jgi:hypothetical protein
MAGSGISGAGLCPGLTGEAPVATWFVLVFSEAQL